MTIEDTLRVPPPILQIVKSLVLVVLSITCPKSQLVGVQLMIGAAGISSTIISSKPRSVIPFP